MVKKKGDKEEEGDAKALTFFNYKVNLLWRLSEQDSARDSFVQTLLKLVKEGAAGDSSEIYQKQRRLLLSKLLGAVRPEGLKGLAEELKAGGSEILEKSLEIAKMIEGVEGGVKAGKMLKKRKHSEMTGGEALQAVKRMALAMGLAESVE